ncbi:hypothetical protein JS528_03110 [Bifidobacterium sp. MA2]|uniref:ABC transporter permease n=1 Tax=Bifidobacterium santillanense TaxID=2809028 RepID=A0ABS5UN97_9BIFI|nr:hypothetical protein [Bifidobacterium santillanense]MBT1172366.1 hypothetical protein [Bifidobacterium santillanense]
MNETTIKAGARPSSRGNAHATSGGAYGRTRQFRLALVRCLTLYAVVFAVAVIVLAVLTYQRYRAMILLPNGLSGDVNVERILFPMLFVAALVWQWGFFATLLCHGVSRRSFVGVSAIGATAISLAVSMVIVAARYPLIVLGGDVRMVCAKAIGGCLPSDMFKAPLSEQFLYAWQEVGSTQTVCDGSTCSIEGGTATYSPMLQSGWLFMFLKFLSLMLAATALGMLVGAVLAWAAGRGVWTLGVVAGLGWGLFSMRFDMAYGVAGVIGEPWLATWLIGAASGRVGSLAAGSGVDFGTYIVWIPLVESLVLFALCVLIVSRLTSRREIRPGRGRLG